MKTIRIEEQDNYAKIFHFDNDTGVLKSYIFENISILKKANDNKEILKIIKSVCDNDGTERVIYNPRVKGAYSAPFKLYVDITDACQLNCAHCLTKNLNIGKELSLDTLKDIAKECSKLGVFYVKLGGGEPFLHKNFKEIVTLFRESGCSISISTNGYCITPKISQFIYDNKVKLSISIEGTQEINDSIRGKGHFFVALRALSILKENNVNAFFRVTLTKKILSVDIIKSLIQLADAHNVKIKFSYCRPAGSSIDNELLLSNEDKRAYHEVLQYLNSPININKVMIDEGMMFEQPKELENLLLDGRICGAANRSMHINSSGNISPCVFLGPNYKEEVFYKLGDMEKYWNETFGTSFRKIRDVNMPNECLKCDRLCKYECLASRLYFNNKFEGTDPNCLKSYFLKNKMVG